MKKRIVALTLALLICLSVLPVTAGAEEPERGVMTYTEHIAPQYEAAQLFSEGLAAVKKDGKWGYIDEDNKVVIPFQYDFACKFNEGVAVVGSLANSYENSEWGWDEVTGEYIVTKTYQMNEYEIGLIDQAGNYTPFINPYGYDYETGEQVDNMPMRYSLRDDVTRTGDELVVYGGYIALSSDGMEYEIFDTNGRMVEFPIDSSWYSSVPVYWDWPVTEGVLIKGFSAAEGGEQEYYDIAAGKFIEIADPSVIPNDYYWYELRPFNRGIAPVGVVWWSDREDYFGTEIRWGFIDRSGNWVIQPVYANWIVAGFKTVYQVFGDTGLAMIENSAGKWGAIDRAGRTVIPFQYDELRPYYFGLAAFKQGGKYGYLDASGKVAIPAQYVVTSGFGSNGYAVAYDGQNAFLIDTAGNVIPGSDNVDPDNYFVWDDDGVPTMYTPGEYLVTEENGKYGYSHIEYLPPLPAESEMHAWAYEEVTAAIEEELVPVYLQNLYLNNITREDFCAVAVQAVEEVLGKDVEDVVEEKTGKSLNEWVGEYPFADTSSSTIVAANALGIVTGRGEGIFDPYSSITRQEAATMLMRFAKAVGMDAPNGESIEFNEMPTIPVWAKEGVSFVSACVDPTSGKSVMGGTGDNQFSPLDSYTREQSYMTIYRLFQAILAEK